MSEDDLHNLLALAVEDVLETMFFSESLGPCQPDAGAAELQARVAFTGETFGVVAVRISPASARSLTASFLGESEDLLNDIQIAHVVCELTNMLCGCIASKMASRGCFDLSSPELIGESDTRPTDCIEVQHSFAIEHGTLTVSLFSSVSA